MKFNKKEEIQDPIVYLNKKKSHKFVFFTKWGQKELSSKSKKVLRKVGLISLPVLAICLGTTIGIITNNNAQSSGLVNEVVIDNNVTKRRVYLLSTDNMTVPLTVSLDKKNNVYEEMLDVINLSKVSSKASNEYIHGFINEDATVTSFTINENNNLMVDFSTSFFENDNYTESKKIEALGASLLQFDNIDSVSFSINGEEYKSNIDSTNLNKFYQSNSLIENKELVTVFYERKYGDDNYLVPISMYAEKGNSSNITFVNALFKKLPSKLMLNNLDIYNHISSEQTEKSNFSLTVNQSALIDEQTVNKELYETILLSLDLMKKDESVSFEIEGQTLSVEGVYAEESISVGSIYYNEIEL